MKKFFSALLAGFMLFSSTTCFAASTSDPLKGYHDMLKANASATTVEKKGQLNTRYEYTGVDVAEKAVKLGFKKYLNSAFKYYNGENLEIREIPSNGQTKALHLEVSCVEYDMQLYMPNPDNFIKGKFKQLCGLILPNNGDKLYQKVMSTKQKEQKFSMGGRTFTVIFIDNKYDIYVSPYAPKTVKVSKSETFTGTSILPKLYPLGFSKLDLAGCAKWNPYGKKGASDFDIAHFVASNGQYDITMLLMQSNAEIDKKYKKILNLILPKSGNTLYNILDNPKLPKTKVVYLDGRRIEINRYSFGVELLFSPIYK